MRKLLLAAVAGAAFLAPGSADARSWVVWADAPSKPPVDIESSHPILNQFFPSTLAIRVGDRVTFRSEGFHTASFLGSTPADQVPLIMPDTTGGKYTGVTDSTGAPFWFNGGPPKFIFNPRAIQSVGSARVTRTGLHSSGVLLFRQGKRHVFVFTKPGRYQVVCLVHPGMKGTIIVKPRRAKVLTPSKVAGAVLGQLNRSWAQARALAMETPPTPNTVFAGVGKETALLAFQPKTLSVPVGATVTWTMNSPTEVHNVAFGDFDYITRLLEATDLLPVAPGAPNQVSPFFPFGSEPPGPYVHTGANHGNGFLATPTLDPDPNSPPPQSFSVRFTKAGTHSYLCMIHGKDMAGEVVVRG